ncbi:hypothetical protein SCUCBS95973_004345 [Sporothrix curviconia]|uniref:DUF2415 domain-containing protein n=1 Tax=Sporothrix curviconia TaxID=1260050 RepID=A0ABP0BMS5_9PEZI
MAVKDVKDETAHWQLRSLIGVSQRHLVYFPAGEANLQIQEFNTHKRRSETIALLLFSPRCLVAHDGWICCGGEEGEFVAIRPKAEPRNAAGRSPSPGGAIGSASGRGNAAGEERQGHDRNSNDNANANADADADMEDEEYDDFDMRMTDAAPALVTVASRFVGKSEKFGTDRVNCITIWTPSPIVPIYPGAYTCPIGVLANNDKHVTLVNLDTAEELDVMGFPDCVNRSLLSPDGRLLASVSDDPYLYIHERVEKPQPGGPLRLGLFESQSSYPKHYEWKLLARHHLRGQSSDDVSVHRGSFAACFSNTGRYLAVGTQYGVIHVFETASLGTPNEGLVACFNSSNTNVDSGAVREMSFCPGPYDLLAWSEDHGAVGVADARNGFVPRQILSLCDDAAYEHLDIQQTIHISAEVAEERRRRLQAQATGTFTGTALRNAINDYELAAGHTPLSLEETQSLSLFQERRLRRERQLRGQQPGPTEGRDQRDWEQEHLGRRALSLSRNRPSMFSRAAAAAAEAEARNLNSGRNSSTALLREQGENMSSAVNEILGSLRSLRSARDAADLERRWLSPNPANLLQTSRRGGAFAASLENDDSGSDDNAFVSSSRDPAASAATARQQDPMWTAGESSSGGRDGRDGLSSSRTLDTLHAYTLGDQLGSGSIARIFGGASGAAGGRRTASHALILPSMDPVTLPGAQGYETIVSTTRRAREPGPLEQKDGHTAGLAWSEDGSILYVATEGGIYEFRVNVKGRMFYPSVTMR